MIYKLENEKIKVTASTYGGELNSITEKLDNTEYLWNGDPAGWEYHAPVLFPVVGAVVDNKYRIDGTVYHIPKHGFARTLEFELVDQGPCYIVFRLNHSKHTLEVYPYRFTLQIKYTLDKGSVRVEYKVINKDNKDIYFSIGAHPAFVCPRKDNETIDDYYFEFDSTENARVMMLNAQGCLLRQKRAFLENACKINLTKETFAKDALIFEHLRSNRITLKSLKSEKIVTVEFGEFSFLGLWAPVNGAKFICIEPWNGHADYEDFTGEFRDKEDHYRLERGEELILGYTISIE